MNKYFELIIFTAAVKEYADWIIDRIDCDNVIAFRLYRRHTTQFNQMFLKDLRKLNRDLKRTLILDNNPENFCFQPDNGIYYIYFLIYGIYLNFAYIKNNLKGIFIKSWFDDPNDTALKDLAKILKEIATKHDEDYRIGLKAIKSKMKSKYSQNMS